MLKSPEQYLSTLDFDAPVNSGSNEPLNPSERAFIEKYLGLEIYEKLPQLDPGGRSQHIQQVKTLEAPRITVTPPSIKVEEPPREPVTLKDTAPKPAITTPQLPKEKPQAQAASAPVRPAPLPRPQLAPVSVKISEPLPPRPQVKVELKFPEPPRKPAEAEIKESKKPEAGIGIELAEKPKAAPGKELPSTPAGIKPPQVSTASTLPRDDVKDNVAVKKSGELPAQAKIAPQAAGEQPTQQIPAQVSPKEQLKQESEIQVVSFYVAGQLFLLPVAGIQEVLRHMEVVKVPQAPDFVAGVINLRGRVTPLIHLSALLTTAKPEYGEKNFIIVCGSDTLQLGLIIDRISSMHMLKQNKIIWNVESKLGDSGEYLCAIADLDDRVCGIVAPEMITQKLLS